MHKARKIKEKSNVRIPPSPPIHRKAGSLETGFFVPAAPSFRASRPLQAYLGLAEPSRHSPVLALSRADIRCHHSSEAYPSSAVVMLANNIINQ